jgi:hypothetical protein
MNYYRFTLIHDNGKHVISCYAEDLLIAVEKIKAAEGCPEQAIKKIEVTLKK